MLLGDATKYPVSAGDTIAARVTKNGDGSFTLSETATANSAKSAKWTFSKTLTATDSSISDTDSTPLEPGDNSAEVIMEQGPFDPLSNQAPASQYGSITFFAMAFSKTTSAVNLFTTLEYSNRFTGSIGVPATISPTKFIVYQR